MTGSSIAVLVGAAITGVIIADFLIHPAGTTAAANGANALLVPTYGALLGSVPGYSTK